MRDITFYDLNFNRLYILPQSSGDRGYISAYAEKEFNGVGSLEIDFVDDELFKLVKSKDYRDNLMIEWNGFWGIMCAFQYKDGKIKLTGESLNGLLKRVVVTSTGTQSGTVKSLAWNAVNYVDWLTCNWTEDFTKTVSYTTDALTSADKYLSAVLALDNAGYEVKADIVNKQFVFNLLKSNESDLLLSTNNLNAYDFSETYINRNVANGGYYQKEVDGEKKWYYITLDESLIGVFKKDVVLNSKTEWEARQELKAMVAESETELKTRGLTFGIDYNLGDVVRVQNNDTAVKKRITSVIMSQENGYIENPIFSEVE